jgi:D-glycero-D-manno-heptose 1,7-bisphosphate phosphatase
MDFSKPSIFLDRDGTICEEVGYLRRKEDIRLIDGAAKAIQMINQENWLVVVVSNQSGVARGYLNEDEVKSINKELLRILEARGAKIDGMYYCPHHPEGNPPYRINCSCRKPSPGMILKAVNDLHVNLGKSVVIGDKFSDIQTAQGLHIPGILLLTGYGREELDHQKDKWDRQPDYIANNLMEAITWWFNRE